MTKIVNFYCGPGGGKSTSASYLFYLLKNADLKVELVQEYVKTWAWENRTINDFDQFYFLGKQARKEFLLFDKVDYVITDCPVALSGYYAEKYCTPTVSYGVNAAVHSYYKSCKEKNHTHIHVLLNRIKPFQSDGRYQTEQQAKEMDKEIIEYLDRNNFSYININSDKYSLNKISKMFIQEKEIYE